MRALVNGRVLDGASGRARDGLAVLLAGDRIEAVLPAGELPGDVERVDVGGRTVMPGLIDCHAHFALWAFDPPGQDEATVAPLRDGTWAALEEVLRAGCVGVRDCGGLETAFRDGLAAGRRPGPRIQTSLTILSPVNGIADGGRPAGALAPHLHTLPAPECTGPDEARAKVREVVAAGADFIKVGATGGVSSPRREPRQQLLSDAELAAIVDEAHRLGKPVICHALGGPGLMAALRAGVDTIEHGVWLDDEAIGEMVRRGTWYVPTLSGYEQHLRYGGPLQRGHAEAIVGPHRESVRRARAAGVRIAAGSDGGVYDHDFTLELELLAAAGVPAHEVIAAATSRAAACLGWDADLGTLVPGRRADLLVVDGDPARDVTVLRRPDNLRVMQAGVFLDE